MDKKSELLRSLPQVEFVALLSSLTWFVPKEALLLGIIDEGLARADTFGGLTEEDLDSPLEPAYFGGLTEEGL